jgi:hypothetical protein
MGAPLSISAFPTTANILITENEVVTTVTTASTPTIVIGEFPVASVDPLKDALFLYDGEERLVKVEWSDGSYKDITWSGSTVVQTEFTKAGGTVRQTFIYDDGLLESITEEAI